MTIDTATTVPSTDHSDAGGDADTLFASVFGQSALMGEVLESEDVDGVTDDSSDEDLEDDDDSAGDEDNDDDEVTSPDDDDAVDDDNSTEGDEDSEGDEGEVDWDFEVPVKIDGEESNISLEELRKGYATSQHLSKQGRELGDERKAFDTQRTTELDKITNAGKILQSQITDTENAAAELYTELKKEIKELRKEGDKFAAIEKQEDLEKAQADYWAARNKRETLEKNLTDITDSEKTKKVNETLKTFNEDILTLIPDFDEERGTKIRAFANEQGLSDEVISTLMDANAVKLIDDYRILKEAQVKGKKRSKNIPSRKRVPTRKSTTPKTKKKVANAKLNAKIESGEATDAEGFDFLRGIAEKYV